LLGRRSYQRSPGHRKDQASRGMSRRPCQTSFRPKRLCFGNTALNRGADRSRTRKLRLTPVQVGSTVIASP
jgi:hypothetical protein